MQEAPRKPLDSHEATQRRPFLIRFMAGGLGFLAALFPFAVGWGVVADPLHRQRKKSNDPDADAVPFLRVCPLDALPADDLPHQFAVTTDVADAWTRTTGQRIGSVFLMRTDVGGKPTVTAFTATCPHLGCAVDFIASAGQYECPCHVSAFAKDGEKLFGPALRGLDPLQVKLEKADGQTEVLVAYERFRTGIAERIPVA